MAEYGDGIFGFYEGRYYVIMRGRKEYGLIRGTFTKSGQCDESPSPPL